MDRDEIAAIFGEDMADEIEVTPMTIDEALQVFEDK